MKKKLVLLLISCITLETLLSGCSIPFLSHGDSSVDATEEALDFQDTSYDSTTTLDQEIEKKKNYFESHE